MLESRGQHKRAAEICKDIGDEYNEQSKENILQLID